MAEGPEGLYIERRGRGSKGRTTKFPKEIEEDLLKEVQRLRAEIAYLKKLQALVLEEMDGATKLADNVMFSDKSVSLASWIVMSDYAEENADKVLAFTKAIYKAMDYAADGNYDEISGYVSKQTKTDKDSVYAQRGDAEWLTGKEVAAGAADGTVAGYYQVQQDVFVAAGDAEATPVEDYVMLQNMIDAGK